MSILDFRFAILDCLAKHFFLQSKIQNPKSKIELLILFVQSMAAAATAKLIKLKPVRRVLFVFGRYVIAFLALGTLQNYIISRHKTSFVQSARFSV